MSDIVTYSVPESTQLELVIIDDKSMEPANLKLLFMRVVCVVQNARPCHLILIV